MRHLRNYERCRHEFRELCEAYGYEPDDLCIDLRSKGGALLRPVVEEITRKLSRFYSDPAIALAMNVTPDTVRKRRLHD